MNEPNLPELWQWAEYYCPWSYIAAVRLDHEWLTDLALSRRCGRESSSVCWTAIHAIMQDLRVRRGRYAHWHKRINGLAQQGRARGRRDSGNGRSARPARRSFASDSR